MLISPTVSLMACCYHVELCASPRRFHDLLAKLKVPKKEWPGFLIDEHTFCTTHGLWSPVEDDCAIVCIGYDPGMSGIDIAAFLVHEAVHIWQWHCIAIMEAMPSDEFEAYSVQMLSRELMTAYMEQTKRRK